MIYALHFSLPATVILKNEQKSSQSRDDVIGRFNDFCGDLREVPSKDESSKLAGSGMSASNSLDPEVVFFGVTEGTLLAEEAHERGYETESWVLDAGEAPHERDWLSHEKVLHLIAYYKTEKAAKQAESWLTREYVLEKAPVLEAQEEQDWNATWKASFTGIDIDEGLRVLPPWHDEWLAVNEKLGTGHSHGSTAGLAAQNGIVAINPGAGFGTGTHETTQLCLRILRKLGNLSGKTVLDFGSGSGILGITAALLGAKVYCVEIDPLANDNARENAEMNGVSTTVKILTSIPAEIRGGKVDILIANILRPILIQFAPEIKDCLRPEAELVLSGLVETDLDQVIDVYQKGGAQFKVHRSEKNEWRALWLRRG